MANLKSHTVKTTTYKLPESSGMMGTVQQAIKWLMRWVLSSLQVRCGSKIHSLRLFGVAAGVLGYMVGATFAPKDSLMKSPFLERSNWGIIGGMMSLCRSCKVKGGSRMKRSEFNARIAHVHKVRNQQRAVTEKQNLRPQWATSVHSPDGWRKRQEGSIQRNG